MLLSMPKRFARVFVVCDALDEMDQDEQRVELLPLFHDMKDSGIVHSLTTRSHFGTTDVRIQVSRSS